MSNDATSGIKNVKLRDLTIVLSIILPMAYQYFNPMIEHALGRDEERMEQFEFYVDSRFHEIDSTLRIGTDVITYLNGEVEDMNASREQWRSQPFSIGLRAKAGTDSLWYKASNGKTFIAIYDPFHMWWKYVDPEDWQNPHKAVYFEIPWADFEERQNTLTAAILYFQTIQQ